MKKEKIESKKAPKAVGPYSQAIRIRKFIFCAGQIGIDPKTNELVKGGVEEEVRQTLNNLKAVLESAGVGFENVVKVDIFLKSMADYAKVNEIYAKFFKSDPKPARVTVEVSNLPKNAKIEISCIAHI